MIEPSKPGNRTAITAWIGLGLALVVLGGSLAFNLYLEHGRTAVREEERLSAQARVVAENLGAQLASANAVLMSIRDELTDVTTPIDSRHLVNYLDTLAVAMPGVRTLLVLDAEGEVIASNRHELTGTNLEYREYFQAVRQHADPGLLYVSPPFKTVLGVYAFNISRLIPGSRGEFAGIVSATLDPEYFKTLMSSVLYEPDMWDAVAHGDGLLILMQPGRESLYGMNLVHPGSFFTRHRNSGQVATVLSGTVYSTKEVRMLAQHTVQPAELKMDKPLVVAVSRDLDRVFQPWRRNAMMQAALFGLIAGLSLLGRYVFRRRQRQSAQETAEVRVLAERFAVALDRISAFIYMKDRQRRYVYANRPTLALFKCSEEELRGSDDARFFPPATVARLYDIDTRVLEQGADTAEEVITQDADGSQRVYWEIKAPIYEEGDHRRIWGLCGISTDITELRKQQDALQESEERFRSMFDAAAIGMALISQEGHFKQVNRALCTILGYSPAELQEKTIRDVTHPDDLDNDLSLMNELWAGTRDSYLVEKRYFHKEGHVIWVLLSASAVRDSAGKVRYLIEQIQDITERVSLYDKLERQATTDYLTGISNRRYFMERGEVELARAQRYGNVLSLFMLDIDRFKVINDMHGHHVGDLVLQQLGAILRGELRNIDLVGRLGGEEFAVLLPETDPEQAFVLAERLRNAIASTEVVRETGLPLRFTVSIGVATLGQKAINLDTLLAQADLALYEAKATGRNRVCVAA